MHYLGNILLLVFVSIKWWNNVQSIKYSAYKILWLWNVVAMKWYVFYLLCLLSNWNSLMVCLEIVLNLLVGMLIIVKSVNEFSYICIDNPY